MELHHLRAVGKEANVVYLPYHILNTILVGTYVPLCLNIYEIEW